MSGSVFKIVDGQREEITASGGILGSVEPIYVRNINHGVTRAQIIEAQDGNNLDEIVVLSGNEYYILYADELHGSVKMGDKIEFFGKTGIVAMEPDDEWNEELSGAALIAGATLATGGAAGWAYVTYGATALTATATSGTIAGGSMASFVAMSNAGAAMRDVLKAVGATVIGSVVGAAGSYVAGEVAGAFEEDDLQIRDISTALPNTPSIGMPVE